MIEYEFPLRELKFLLGKVVNLRQVLQLPGYEACDEESFFAAAEAAGSFARQELLPLNRLGDEEGASLTADGVAAPPGFGDAYKVFCEDGWSGLAMEEEHGGEQLPYVLYAALREAMSSTNLGFSLIHDLNLGACETLSIHGTEEQKQLYLPNLVSGKWAATMCLTEPHSGTDLGLIRTRAVADEGGRYVLNGNKIFITWGDHDMAENIVHLVLARVEGAEPGVRGLSLFLVPKFFPDAEGDPGEFNNVAVMGLEKKMGIHGSPTCALAFDGATGWLVGEEGKGLAAMFVMMNSSRLSVGLQGLGIAETAFQSATAYAHERLQGQHGPHDPDLPPQPLTVHPDVRRRLLVMQAELDTGRALAYWGASLMDVTRRHPDERQRASCHDRLSALTPVLKSHLSDLGLRHANEAVQMHGGHGFIRENGVEQLVRDVRITSIYEGTNAIQARDLVMRKLRRGGGEGVLSFLDEMDAEIEALEALEELGDLAELLLEARRRLSRLTEWMRDASEDAALTAACDYLEVVALSLSGMMAARMARATLALDLPFDPDYLQEKRAVARIYFTRVLPKAQALETVILSGAVGAARATGRG